MPTTPRKIRIGRDAACDLVLSDRSVSRKHAELLIDSTGAMEIVDLDSSSGTYLVRAGKEDSISRAKLKPGDVLRFGEVEFSLKDLQQRVEDLAIPEAPPAKKATPPPLPSKRPTAGLPPNAAVAATPTLGSDAFAGGRMIRCECGTIKKKGSVCPSCRAAPPN
jgi:pSer/pThr/pTyr-binding forkhead associated (FHA) protein